jgi:sterol desaturase/sphingolipid hydroxylase (fatty acid hydroxylase superfamily)
VDNQIVDLQLLFDRLLKDPGAAIAGAFHAMRDKGFLDVTALWRQFYDESVAATDLNWRNLLIYLIGCAVFYLYCVRKKRAIAAASQFARFLLPREVTASRSFRIDVQFYLATLLKLPQLMKVGGFLLLLSLQQRLVSAELHQLPLLHAASQAIAPLPQWARLILAYVIALLAFEFGYYWAHRLMHKSRLLWQFHKVHHYSRQLNLLVGIRHHPFDDLIVWGIAGLTMVVALCLFFDDVNPRATGFLTEPYWLAFAVLSMNTVLNRFTHTHLGFSLGRALDRVLISPAIHILHHSRDFQDTNYGNFISIWDVAFGTFRAHEPGTKVNVGISEFDDDHYNNIVQLLFEPCVDALKLLRLWPASRESAIL